jgi:ABC-type molybdenum transport system ATPase subunit/photorepair protein PhrA
VWEIKKQIGYVSAELQTRYFVDLPADRVVASGFFGSIGWLQPTTRAQDKRVREVMAQLGLSELAGRSILQMSYGQARKVLVARALVNKPKLLILDEVFDGLDAQFRADLSAMFEQIAAQGAGVILVSHHEGDVLGCITHRMRIEGGRVVRVEERVR